MSSSAADIHKSLRIIAKAIGKFEAPVDAGPDHAAAKAAVLRSIKILLAFEDGGRSIHQPVDIEDALAATAWLDPHSKLSDDVNKIKDENPQLFTFLSQQLAEHDVEDAFRNTIADSTTAIAGIKDKHSLPPDIKIADLRIGAALKALDFFDYAQSRAIHKHQLKNMGRRAAIFTGVAGALSGAYALGVGGTAKMAEKFSKGNDTFNLADEVTAAIAKPGGTTLTASQNEEVQNIKKHWRGAGGPDAPATKEFFKALEILHTTLGNSDTDRTPVLARLLYFGAHDGPPFKFLANLIAACPETRNIKFITKFSPETAFFHPSVMSNEEFSGERDIFELIKTGVNFDVLSTNAKALYSLPARGFSVVEELNAEIHKAETRRNTVSSHSAKPPRR